MPQGGGMPYGAAMPPGAPPPGAPAAAGTSAPPVWLLIGPALGAVLGLVLATSLVGPGGLAVQRDLGVSAAALGVVIAAYLLPMVLVGALGVVVGRRFPTAVAAPGLVLLLVGLLLSALTPSAPVIVVGRVLCGIGAGAAAGTVVGLALGYRRRGLALGLTAGVGLVALVLGPVDGFVWSTFLAWRWIFFAAVPVALVAIAVTAVAGIVRLTRRPAVTHPYPPVTGTGQPAFPPAGQQPGPAAAQQPYPPAAG